jgi:phosphoribosylaminoimidazole-succinocarboxamide synthase
MAPAEATNRGDPRAAGPAIPAAGGFVRSGKVRDLFEVDDCLLLVTSDRLSAFDVVLPTPIPDKGRVLTGLSRFWFGRTADVIPNHLVGTDPAALPGGFTDEAGRRELRGRMMLCRRANVLPVEIIVRGYVAGSGWKDYRRTGSICGIELPGDLRESDRLPEPIFTPSTKAEVGHDENIGFDAMVLGRLGLRARPAAGQLRQAVRPRLAGGPAVGQDLPGPEPAARHRCRDPPTVC